MPIVKPELRLLALFIAVLPAGLATAQTPSMPIIRLWNEPAATEAEVAPSITLAIPCYALTEHERETIAACLILEAASQGDFGMRGVMAVIRNRSRGLPELFAQTVLRPKQFSALNRVTSGREHLSRAIARAKRDRMWSTALQIVDDATLDTWHDPTAGATHYTRSVERTRWTRSLAKTVTIGAHSFYR